MSAGGGASPSRRVLLAAESLQDLEQGLLTARQMALVLKVELAGLFIENARLLRLAALPFAREIGHSSGGLFPLEAAQLERRFLREAEHMHAELAALAAELALPWSFEVRRGSLCEGVLGAHQADFIVLGSRPALWRLKQAPAGFRPPVAVYYDGSAPGERALRTALALVGGHTGQLRLLLPAGSGETLGTLRSQAARMLNAGGGEAAAAGPAPALHRVDGAAGALDQAGVLGAGALVLPAALLPARAEALEALLNLRRCALVLVR